MICNNKKGLRGSTLQAHEVKLMKKILISLMLLTTLFVFVGCHKVEGALTQEEVKAQKEAQYNDASVEEIYVSFDTSTEPLNLAVPAETDQAALKALAVQMYDKACWNDQHCVRRLAYTQDLITATATVISAQLRNLVLKIKNGDECLQYDLQPNKKTKTMTFDGHGEAMYAKVGLAHPYYERVDNSKSTPLSCRVSEDWVGSCDFSNAKRWLSSEPTDMLYFHSTHKSLYTATDAIITVDTIKAATITHNDEEGYYTLHLELDPDPASVYMLANLRASNTMMANAWYESINETIEIWDNGFFKRFLSEDQCVGGLVSLFSCN